METCAVYTPWSGPHRRCTLPTDHGGEHLDTYGTKWEITSQQPDRAAQVAEIQALTELRDLSQPDNTERQALLAEDARVRKIAPSKEEILAAIRSAEVWSDRSPVPEWGTDGAKLEARMANKCASFGVRSALLAVEKLFADRGL